MSWRTLPELLFYNAEFYPDRPFARFLKRGELVSACSYSQVLQQAISWAALLLDRGLHRGEPVILALPNSDDFVYAYFGTLLAGGIPAATLPIRHLKPGGHHLIHVAQRLRSLSARMLLVPEIYASLATLAPLSEIEKLTVLTRLDLQPSSQHISPSTSPSDIAVLQFTSGTTSQPKIVQLANSALLAQMHTISTALKVDPHSDSGLSWLPFFHDMGLIGFLLTPMYRAMNVTLLQTEDFMMRPSLWIKALSDFGATITCGPTSAYALCARFLKDSDVELFDLSNLRACLIGAEVISHESVRQFAAKLQPAGFRASSLVSAYGLAENGVAVTLMPLDTGVEFETIDQEILQTEGCAQPVAQMHTRGSTRNVACVGIPVPQTKIAIVNSVGERLGERQVGEVLVQSPGLMRGYYEQPEATSNVLRDGWLWTGDLGYIVQNKLYITGRKKEVLIVGGRNYYPDDLELVVSEALGVRQGNTVAIACEDPERATESVVVLVESSLTDQAERDALRQRVRQALIEADYPISSVVLLRPKTIQTTLNGKLKRVDIKSRYLKGEFSHDN